LTGSLAGTDRRWVTLESAKFVAANTDTLDDSHELATCAHEYATCKFRWERISYGLQFPKAVGVVTGLGPTGGS
jgi:hypothetical protein